MLFNVFSNSKDKVFITPPHLSKMGSRVMWDSIGIGYLSLDRDIYLRLWRIKREKKMQHEMGTWGYTGVLYILDGGNLAPSRGPKVL